jgi:hypothetical protein
LAATNQCIDEIAYFSTGEAFYHNEGKNAPNWRLEAFKWHMGGLQFKDF